MIIGLLIALLVIVSIGTTAMVIVAVGVCLILKRLKDVNIPMMHHVWQVYNQAKKAGNNVLNGRI